MSSTSVPPAAMTHSYSDQERDLLRAVRHLIRADREMRSRLSSAMQVNPTQLRSLRHVIRAVDASADEEMAGVTPRELADHLGITTAAVTVLVARLVSSGHLERRPHPTDRRSVFLVPTERARDEMTKHLSEMHERMRDIASSVPEHARSAVVDFLQALTFEMEGGRLDLGRS